MLRFSKFVAATIIFISLFAFVKDPARIQNDITFKFPYKEAGLTERQAAAHLLNRFSFGPTPQLVDEVVKTGLEKWFMQQLDGKIPDEALQKRLSAYDALNLSNTEANKLFPRPIDVLRMAREDGVIPKDSATDEERKLYKKELAAYVKEKNFRRQPELYRQFIAAKILRATYSNNQLQEVMTDFWFNHFNVSLTKRDCAMFIPAFERDVIRPNATGKFEELLIATAKSPAMLMYLDNFNSAATADETNDERMKRRLQKLSESMDDSAKAQMMQRLQQRRKNQGLNENYAREVMELHTLGVDGGYSQSDVTNAAKILTGWTIYPFENSVGKGIRNVIEKMDETQLKNNGFIHEGDFLFAMNRHDKAEKTVLGKKFVAGAGYEEGIALLKMLAHHPSTAMFISKKLAARFVTDEPPVTLVQKMAKTFTEKEGDIRQVLITMVSSKEFWDKSAMREKTKSPFELVISTVRALNADVQQPYQLFNWMDKMGQKIYYFQAPTGFPDRAQYWINTGALLNRMNFGLAIAANQVRGVKTNLLDLNNHHEPESAGDALVTYGKIMMPERDLTATIKRLSPMLTQPLLKPDVGNAAGKTGSIKEPKQISDESLVEDAMKENEGNNNENMQGGADKTNMMAQVVGIIIGSPEFQRR
ncbi:MAG: DUF1800 domain-containing protein [Bacteroidetes bacterium]|nr:DUF1800 domain-containing protein [Bacteroidota bacterium]